MGPEWVGMDVPPSKRSAILSGDGFESCLLLDLSSALRGASSVAHLGSSGSISGS
jgi:hypothetical protein